MFEYILFSICGLGLVFVLVRGGVIDIKTEYVPDNIVIGSYLFSIIYVLTTSISLKSFDPLLNGILGFIVGFIIPAIVQNGIYYLRYFSLKLRLKKEHIELEIEKDANNEKIDIIIEKKYFTYAHIIISIIISIIVFSTKRYELLWYSLIALFIETGLNKLLKRFYVIKRDYTENKYVKKDEKSISEKIEDDLEVGVGSGDILIFGAMGILLSPLGFLISFIYASFVHIITVIFLSCVNKINPFKYAFPFIPALSVGVLMYITGCDQYLFNFWGIVSSLLSQ